jgi:hypothetical protein
MHTYMHLVIIFAHSHMLVYIFGCICYAMGVCIMIYIYHANTHMHTMVSKEHVLHGSYAYCIHACICTWLHISGLYAPGVRYDIGLYIYKYTYTQPGTATCTVSARRPTPGRRCPRPAQHPPAATRWASRRRPTACSTPSAAMMAVTTMGKGGGSLCTICVFMYYVYTHNDAMYITDVYTCVRARACILAYAGSVRAEHASSWCMAARSFRGLQHINISVSYGVWHAWRGCTPIAAWTAERGYVEDAVELRRKT